MTVRYVRDPIADCLGRRILQRSRARSHRDYFRAHQPHAEDIQRLPAHVFLTHVHHALHPEPRTNRGRRNAVLSCARLGDDATLAHASRQQRLPNGVVDLVGTRVVQILAFEEHRRPHQRGEPRSVAQWRRTTNVSGKQIVELGNEGGISHRLRERVLQPIKRRNERFRHIPPTVAAKAVAGAYRGHRSTLARPTASMNSCIRL